MVKKIVKRKKQMNEKKESENNILHKKQMNKKTDERKK